MHRLMLATAALGFALAPAAIGIDDGDGAAGVSGGGNGREGRAERPLVPERTTAYRAKKLVLGDGRVIDDGVVLVEEGVIRRAGSGLEIPAGAGVVEHDGTLSPGLIALHSYEGGGADLFDATRAVMETADVSLAFDPASGDFARALASGVTAIVLAPTPASLCPGTTAVVKTAGGTVVKKDAQLALGLGAAALKPNEFPTGYAAALAELEGRFADPKGNFGKAASGNLPVLIQAGTRHEIQRALAFARRFQLRGALLGSTWAEDLVEAIEGSGLSVVCGPVDPGGDAREARSIAALSKAGVRLGFALDAPARHPDSLRFAVALAVRAGMDAGAGLKALTGDAAAIAGVAGRIGRIEPGLDADLVLWSGDPADLGSAVVAVYVDGKLVHGGTE